MMSILSMVIGVLLIVLAGYGYFGAEQAHRSLTALIPALVGVPLVICGWLGRSEHRRKVVMHIAVAVAALGVLAAGGRGLPRIGVLWSNDPAGNQRAVAIILTMFVLCLIFVVFAIKSFVDARRRR